MDNSHETLESWLSESTAWISSFFPSTITVKVKQYQGHVLPVLAAHKHVGIYLSILKWPSGIFWENSLSLYHLCEIYFYMRWEKFIETSNHLWLLIVFWLFLLACSICAEQCKLLKSQDHLDVCTPVVKPRKKFKSILFSRSHRWIWEKRDGNNAAQQPSEHGSDPARSAWGREGGQ